MLDLAKLALEFLHFGLESGELGLHRDQLVSVGPTHGVEATGQTLPKSK